MTEWKWTVCVECGDSYWQEWNAWAFRDGEKAEGHNGWHWYKGRDIWRPGTYQEIWEIPPRLGGGRSEICGHCLDRIGDQIIKRPDLPASERPEVQG